MLGDFCGRFMTGSKTEVMKKDLLMLIGNGAKTDIDRVIVKTMCNFRKDLLEIWTFPSLNRNKINRMAYFEGIEHLDAALGKGKGVFLCVTHFGSWKIVLPALGYNGYKVNQIAANPLVFVGDSEDYYHNLIMEQELKSEASLPCDFIYLGADKSIRPVFKALDKNEIVVVSLDGVVGQRRMTVPFLDGQIMLSTGTAYMSYSTGAPMLPCFIVRQEDNRHKIIIHPPFELPLTIDKEVFAADWTNYFGNVFSEYVRTHPDHYARFLYTVRKYPLDEAGTIIRKRGSR
jgi:KDO2-lipid IV(A) lauroyltransferase